MEAGLTTPASCGTLVLGTGLAGLYAALRAAEHRDVTIATRGRFEESSSFFAQGGVAAALGEDDATELHEADTLRVGRGLCRPEAVALLTEAAPRHVERLRELGVDFERMGDSLDLGLEAGHSRRRVAHAAGGSTGRAIVEALTRRVLEHPRITVLGGTTVLGLISDGVRCYGAHTSRGPIVAGTTVLALGGAASLYARSTNPSRARGVGTAFAWQAGATVADMEFVQFHPTALVAEGQPHDGFLISEAVRGEGAHLLNARGERFMLDRHPAGELAPRDELSRAVFAELAESGERCVYLSLAHLSASVANERFHAIASRLRAVGIDMASDRIPVSPAAHYMMGGVLTDLHARSTLRGLLACGEVACTGVHGANRLASNSLLECLVFADRAGAVDCEVDEPPAWLLRAGHVLSPADEDRMALLRRLLWESAGVVRSATSLGRAAHLADSVTGGGEEPGPATTDEVVAGLIVRAALMREESRGAHYREDFPVEHDDPWRAHVLLRRSEEPRIEPVAAHDDVVEQVG